MAYRQPRSLRDYYERQPPEHLKWTYAFTSWEVHFHWPTGLWLAMKWMGVVEEEESYGFSEGKAWVVFDRCQTCEEWEAGTETAEEAREYRRDYAETHAYLETWETRNYRTAYDLAQDLLDEGVELDDILQGVG